MPETPILKLSLELALTHFHNCDRKYLAHGAWCSDQNTAKWVLLSMVMM